jgi:uncharacterized protein
LLHSYRYRPWGLVTGASSGIGEEFARQLAVKGFNIVLVARREELLETLAEELTIQYDVQTRIVVADLATNNFIEGIRSQTNDIKIELLVNNAGMPDPKSFFDDRIEDQLAVLQVNLTASMMLTRYFGEKMKERQKGGIIFVSSMVAYFPAALGGPMYATTKAALSAFGNSMYYELQPYNIIVLTVSPGLVRTDILSRLVKKNSILFRILSMDTKTLVEKSFKAFGKKPYTAPGWHTKTVAVIILLMRALLPPAAIAVLWKLARRISSHATNYE